MKFRGQLSTGLSPASCETLKFWALGRAAATLNLPSLVQGDVIVIKTVTWLSQPDPDWGKLLALLVSDYLSPCPTVRVAGQQAGKPWLTNVNLKTGDWVFPFRVQQRQPLGAGRLARRRKCSTYTWHPNKWFAFPKGISDLVLNFSIVI